jgi:DNA-binding transcriptional MerR regulator
MSLRSGQVASAAGVNLQTLRYYERRGLLAEPDRTNGGHRVYPDETVTTLRVIKAAQRLGFSLDEISDLLKAGSPHHGTDLKDRAATKLADVEARMADLSVIATTLRSTLSADCDDLMTCASTPDCPLPFTDLPPPAREVR